ncbi:NAD(P)/FAD-dependent oxidoreductase [Komagataeibacter sucrofermentans]|uniref:Aminoacetone oxidase family FAD-binding enzyme n=1 Tax=Komagataeibacter sucrofermentans TaxID=1053551 RepID=A0A318QNU5_9PROT|nr:aminoacetone oxidase family FAD-binding enzyme [Komagataeibacter sucrofermentans]PYD81186.1 aminoacetone oxidase family FAD-binding enzyme [Komagataeibacter sucrofermentans]GBQ44959.1 glutathione reductase [Komagataeibacter sucrofermentans DSM 15973]
MTTQGGGHDAIVLGAGAAGLMAAATAGQGGARVVVLDHAQHAGRKILISGGGRCNFTNMDAGAGQFLSANPHFAKSALARYTPADFLALVQRHRIPWHEKAAGQLFCDRSARDIVDMLMRECAAGHVEMRLSHRIIDVARDAAGHYRVETDHGVFHAPSLIVATGGLSIPKLGATGLAHDLARRFGLRVVAPAPALVPLTFGARDREWMELLAGLSVNVGITCHEGAGRQARHATFRDGMVFTHRGLSGPAILQASSYWQPGEALEIDLLPGINAAARLLEIKRDRPRAGGVAMLSMLLPQRLAQLFARSCLPEGQLAGLPDSVLADTAGMLGAWRLNPHGTEGYVKAEVTRGGVDTASLSSRDMEARDVPGLFMVGEAVDVTGWLGGYNFQWAWASGHAAGQAVAERRG